MTKNKGDNMKKIYRLKYMITAKVQGERSLRPIRQEIELPEQMISLSGAFLEQYALNMALSQRVFKAVKDVRWMEIQTGIEIEGQEYWNENGKSVEV